MSTTDRRAPRRRGLRRGRWSLHTASGYGKPSKEQVEGHSHTSTVVKSLLHSCTNARLHLNCLRQTHHPYDKSKFHSAARAGVAQPKILALRSAPTGAALMSASFSLTNTLPSGRRQNVAEHAGSAHLSGMMAAKAFAKRLAKSELRSSRSLPSP